MDFNTDIRFYKKIDDLLKAIPSNSLKVTDLTIASLPTISNIFENNSLKLPAGEQFKTIDSVLKIVTEGFKLGFTRHDTFTGIGGGVICDMTAFAASIYKRGLKLHLVPTTLLAMVDAAIGGKTGCDMAEAKNMLGTFYPANVLHICPEFIYSLPDSEYRSGLAEVVKTAMLYDEELFEILEKEHKLILQRDKTEKYLETISIIIQKSVNAKKSVVEKDLTETGLRKQLNLGHTFGHALESCCGLGKLTHGEAVAWGISRAIDLSVDLNLCSKTYKEKVFNLLQLYGWETNCRHSQLPNGKTSTDLIKSMKQDKKNIDKNITMILQQDICKTLIQEVDDLAIQRVLQ